jgi:ParB family chromosome partitioning protein
MTTPPETVQQLPIDSVLPSEHNPRLKLRGIDELAASIKEHGVLEPLLVTSNGHNTVHLVAGHRRLAAAKQAGLKTVPCIVRKFEESQQLGIQLVENLQRDDLSPMEEAKGYGKLSGEPYRMATRAIAQLVGRSQSHVVHRLALLKLSPAAAADFESGKLTLTVEDVQALAALPHERQDRVLKETHYGSMVGRIRELEWHDEAAKRRAAEAAKPKPKATARPVDRGLSKAEQEKRANQVRLREEAAAARAAVIPRLLSRGELELQYAARVMVEQSPLAFDPLRLFTMLRLKKQPKVHALKAILEHAGKSKKAAVETILALAIATVEKSIGRRKYYGGLSLETDRLYIERLTKVGYKPTEQDAAILKGKRR